MDNLIIEVGKFYKTRCGYKVIIYAIHPEKERYTNIHGAFLLNNDWDIAGWYPNGNFYNFDGSDLDIVSEWVEPHPAKSWEIDKKILVSDDGKDWIKRHFAKYENGHIFAFTSGKTSWTEDKTDLGRIGIYKFAKPAEEE